MGDFFEKAHNFVANGNRFGSREVKYAPSSSYNVNIALSQQIVGVPQATIAEGEPTEARGHTPSIETSSLRQLLYTHWLSVTICLVAFAGAGAFAILLRSDAKSTVAPANCEILPCNPPASELLPSLSLPPSAALLSPAASLPPSAASLPAPASSLPAPLEIFGREEFIEDAVDKILLQRSDVKKHVCLRGGPGMGKTTIAIGIMYDPRIIQHYARHWVYCQKAFNITDEMKAAKLLEYISESFGLNLTAKGDPQMNIKYFLENNDVPRIIVLDNFETMWEPPGARDAIENILQFLAQFPRLTIVLTTRNAHNPITHPNRVAWHILKSIEPLTPDASRALFTSLSLSESIDNRLDDLLYAVDYVPLAIVLMAAYGQENYTTSQILDIWQKRLSERYGTQTYKDNSDPLIKLDNSIAMSLEGPLLKSIPEAPVLLRIIADLADGIKRDNLQKIASSIPDADRVAATLIRASLLMNSGNSLRMHSTIRSFMLRNYDLDASHEQRIRDFYFHLIRDSGGDPGAPDFLERAWRLSHDETNAQAVLVGTLKHNFSSWVPISMDYANYLIWNTPRIDTIKMVVDLIRNQLSMCLTDSTMTARVSDASRVSDMAARTNHKATQRERYRICPFSEGTGSQHQIADSLFPIALLRLGTMYFRLDRYSDATEALDEAIDWSEKKLNQLIVAAEARYLLGEMSRLRHKHSAALQLYSEAYLQYEEEGNSSGMSACLRGTGIVYFQERRNLSDVLDMINMAQSKCSTDDQACIADCERELGRVYRETNQAESIRLLAKTRSYYLIHGPSRHAGIALYQMSIAYSLSGDYDRAEAGLNEAFEEFRSVRNDAQMGYTVFHLAEMNFKRGSLQESLELFIRSESMFKHMENNYMAGLSIRRQGDVYARLGQSGDARQAHSNAHVCSIWQDTTLKLLIFFLGCVVVFQVSYFFLWLRRTLHDIQM